MSLFRHLAGKKEKTPAWQKRAPSISISSPKYKEFASRYLEEDGSIRPEIKSRIMKTNSVKGVRIGYDQENKRWGLDIIATDTRSVAQDAFISSLPCRIINANAMC